MKRILKVLRSAVLAAALILGMAACSQGVDGGNSTDSSTGSSSSSSNNGNGGNSTPINIETVKVTGTTTAFTGSSANKIWGNKGAFTAARSITVGSFYMGKYEVTKDQYKAVMSDATLNTLGVTAEPSYSTNCPKAYVIAAGETDGKRPVENVSWYDAVYFCNCLSKKDGLTPAYTITDATVSDGTISRAGADGTGTVTIKYISSATVALVDGANGWRLPTEVEWEYAARGGAATYGTDKWNYEYSGADSSLTSSASSDSALDSVGWYCYNICNGGTTTTTNPTSGTAGYGPHEVGKRPSANTLGLYDMSGNVWEWCYDKTYGTSISDSTPLAGPSSGSYRVARGGSYNNSASCACVAYRYSGTPVEGGSYLGFRLVRNAQ